MAALPHSARAAAGASWLAFLSGKHTNLVFRLKEHVPGEDDLDAAPQRDSAAAPSGSGSPAELAQSGPSCTPLAHGASSDTRWINRRLRRRDGRSARRTDRDAFAGRSRLVEPKAAQKLTRAAS
jgi:hypothetical protein